jgi:phosphatidylinositol-3-phosphatase
VSRTQNVVVAALSVFATLVVVLQGTGASGDLRIPASLREPLVVDAPLPAGPAAPPAPAASDAGDEGDSGGGVVDPGVPAETPVAGPPPASVPEEPEPSAPPDEEEPKPSKIEHVFVIALAGHGYDATFGPASAAPYLTQQLRPQGTLLTGYQSLGRADLPDLIAMIGGQPPNDDTRAGCPVFKEIPPGNAPTKSGEITATGCVFPNTVMTVADQMTAGGRTWAAYVEDIDKGPQGAIKCRRPASYAPDDTLRARPGDGYATRHNPFVYFHSLLDLGDCDANDGPLAELETDLASAETTPNLAFVVPNLCNDGTESPCVDGSPGGLPAADAFLSAWVPKILASPAYKESGLLIVTFAGNLAATADEPAPNGTLLVSRYAQAGATSGSEYNPYSLLRSIEDLFALRPLARAADASSFAQTVLGEALVGPVADG